MYIHFPIHIILYFAKLEQYNPGLDAQKLVFLLPRQLRFWGYLTVHFPL